MADGQATSNRVPKGGSRPVGPSDDYLKLLRGEITSREYIRRVSREVADEMDGWYRRARPRRWWPR